MPYDESRGRFLAARDTRQVELDRHLGAGRSLVALSLAVPGATKTPPGAGALFAWAAGEVATAFPGAQLLVTRDDALGPFAVWAVPGDATEVKTRCVAIETSRPAARLIDLDVYSPEGASVDRASIQAPPRPCLCCAEPARECILLARHGFPALVERAAELLAGLPARAAR